MCFVKCMLLLLSTSFICVQSLDFEKCFNMDSISCLQYEVFEGSRRIFDKRTISFGEFFNITDTKERNGKSLKNLEANFYKSHTVQKRQTALEDYIETQVKHWLQGAQISWSSNRMIKALSTSLANELRKEHLYPAEGRAEKITKKKKSSSIILPLLIAVKLKMAAFAALIYMTIAVIAKKAVLAGTISLLVSGFIAVKNLLDTNKSDHSNVPYADWQSNSALWHNPGISVHGTAMERGVDSIISESNLKPEAVKTDRIYH